MSMEVPADLASESGHALADALGQLIHALHEHMYLEEQGVFPPIKGRAQPDGIPFPSDPLTGAERRVLRYLPTHLSAREIAAQLFCSVNTVKTHQRHVYAKLGANSRTEAVMRARALGMLVSARAPLNGHVASRLGTAVRRSGWFAGAEAAEHAGVLEADGACGGLDGGTVADQVLGSLQP